LTTFTWDAGANWPPGTTVELCGNGDICQTGLTGTQATLDLPVNPGDLIQGQARAHAPDGGGSEWATVAQTWPALPVDVWAKYQKETFMAAEVISSAVITWASGVNPAAQNISIPADATAVYLFWGYWDNNTTNIASATLNSNNPSQSGGIAGAGNITASGVAAWYNPATGTQSLDVAWTHAPSFGPTSFVVYVKGGDTTAWRDIDFASNTGSDGAPGVTLTTQAGDLVLRNESYLYPSGPPANASGWTSINTQENNSVGSRVARIAATGTSQAVTAESNYYTVIVGLSIPAAAGGATALPRRALDGPFYGSLQGSVR